MFINVPKRYNFDDLPQSDIDELIAVKVKKEANRYIHHWPDEKISVENARWGPLVKFGKKLVKIPRKADETKYNADELKKLTIEEVKKWIEEQIPNAFGKKKKEAAKKAEKPVGKTKPTKKPAARKKR
jgi:DNA topoisomerase-1